MYINDPLLQAILMALQQQQQTQPQQIRTGFHEDAMPTTQPDLSGINLRTQTSVPGISLQNGVWTNSPVVPNMPGTEDTMTADQRFLANKPNILPGDTGSAQIYGEVQQREDFRNATLRAEKAKAEEREHEMKKLAKGFEYDKALDAQKNNAIALSNILNNENMPLAERLSVAKQIASLMNPQTETKTTAAPAAVAPKTVRDTRSARVEQLQTATQEAAINRLPKYLKDVLTMPAEGLRQTAPGSKELQEIMKPETIKDLYHYFFGGQFDAVVDPRIMARERERVKRYTAAGATRDVAEQQLRKLGMDIALIEQLLNEFYGTKP